MAGVEGFWKISFLEKVRIVSADICLDLIFQEDFWVIKEKLF